MKKGIAVLVLMGLPVIAPAKDLSYSYVEGAAAVYLDYDLGGFFGQSQDFIGLDLRGSFDLDEVASNVFAFGHYKFLTDDVDLTELTLAGGYRTEMDESTDAWAGIGLTRQEVDAGSGFSDDAIAPSFHGGVRHQLKPDIEVGVSTRLVMGDADYTGFKVNVKKDFRENVAFLVELDSYNGELGLLGGCRLTF